MWQASHKGPRWQAYSPSTLKDSKGCCGASLGTMSISAILLGYHTGLPITHAGNVMQRTRGVTMPLFKLRGTSCMVRGDPLHILFCKGLYSHLIGSILHYCCYYEGPGVRTATENLGKVVTSMVGQSVVIRGGLHPWKFYPLDQLG